VKTRRNPLLCELHAHTTWSDGVLSVRELVDLYGGAGFDVLCVTDHTLRPDDPFLRPGGSRCVDRASFGTYLDELEVEAERALARYGLLVVPGLELTYNDFDPLRAAHALAIGLRSYVPIDQGLDESLRRARGEGAAIVAAHPYRTTEAGPTPARTTQRFSRDWRELDELVDRYELFNRTDIFAWVAERGLPGVATGDFHRPEHFAGWKTLVPCTKSEQALLDYLRSRRPVYLSQLGSAALRPAA